MQPRPHALRAPASGVLAQLRRSPLVCVAARQPGGGGKKQQRGFGEAGGARRGEGGSASRSGSGGGRGGAGGGRSSGGGRGRGGNGRGRGNNSKPQQKQPQPDQQRATIKAPPRPEVNVSEPLRHTVLDVLSGWEPAPAPLWGTFCGHLEGVWLGQYAAYTPWGADPEPVWADAAGRYLLHAYCRTREVRDPDHPRGDLLLRTTRRGAYLSDLLAAPPGGGGADAQSGGEAGGAGEGQGGGAAEDDDAEGFPHNAGGAVVFYGGSYSVGPLDLGCGLWDEEGEEGEEGPSAWDLLDGLPGGGDAGDQGAAAGEEYAGADAEGSGDAPDDALAALPASTVVVEQVLMRGGQERRRLVATLKCRRPPGGEIDLEVARLVLYTEHWSSLPPEAGAAEAPLKQPPPSQGFGVAATSLPRASPEQLGGAWNVFGVAAMPVEERDPETGELSDVWVYSSREERQAWSVPGLGAGGDDEGAGDGGSLWLPGGCVATFRMVQRGAAAGAAAAHGGDDNGYGGSSNGSSNGNSSSSSSSSHMAGNGYSNGNGSRAANGHRAAPAPAPAPAPRGVLVSFAWLGGDGGACLTLEREYDAAGRLVEVRHASAVKGGWSGGRM